MLPQPNNEVGLYAARIVSIKNLKNNVKKDVKLVGPPNIRMEKTTKEFEIHIDGPLDNIFFSSDDPKVLEIYVRKSKHEVPYG